MNESNELLEWKKGFLCLAIEKGDCVILDNIDEAPSTLTERLNGLLDKKNDDSEKKFDVPENPNEPQIDIHENFRIICTSNIDKINEMSPAFVNRFDVIVLEDQIENIGEKINDLIKFFLNKSREEKNLEKKEKKQRQTDDEMFGFDKDKNEEEEVKEEDKEEGKEFDVKLLDLIKKKFYQLNDRNSEEKKKGIKNYKTISALQKLCRGIYRLDQIIKKKKKYKNLDFEIPFEEIVEFIFTLLFMEEESKIIISDKIMDILGNELKEQNKKVLQEKYFFENSKTLMRFMVIVYASSCFNNHLCVIGPPGAGKTTAARAFAEILRNIQENNEKVPFYIHTFHQGTRPTDYYGSTTIINKALMFKDGHLTLSLKEGNVFIADEFNISSVSNMKAVTPVLEQFFEEKCIIPGIEGEICINRNFFFIICQNEMCTFGRNDLPEKIKSKVRILEYPPQTGEELQDICYSIFYSLDTSKKKNNELYEKAKLCGLFLEKINKKSIIPKWSLRDIYKLFNRIFKQIQTPVNYHGIEFEHQILFYVMSSVEGSFKDKVLPELTDVIGEVFKIGGKKKELIETYNSPAKLNFGSHRDSTEEGISEIPVYIMKGNCEIFYRNLVKKKNEELNEKSEDFTESIYGLHNLLDGLFNILISNNEEPILIAGETCYKTFLAQLSFKDDKNSYEIVSLNQESTIPQLLGSSSFFTPEDAKKFYLKQLCNIFNENDPIKYLSLLNDWEKNKNEISEYITKKLKNIEKNSSLNYTVNHLKDLLFNERKEDDYNIINMRLEFLPGLFLSAILRKKSLILKNLPNVPTVVLERFNELFSGVHILTLVEDIQNTFTDEKNKELKISNNFRVIATCKLEKVNNLSEALLSRFTVIYVSPYDSTEEKTVLKSKSNQDSKLITTLIEQYKSYFTEQYITFNLSQMISCKKIVKKMDNLVKEHTNNIKICLYTLIKGFHENRTNDINEIKERFEVSFIPSIEGEPPFDYIEKNNEIRLISKLTKLSMHVIKKDEIKKNEQGIAFTNQFIEMIDTILFGLSTYTPVILEGNYGQGKKTAINYVANKLGLEVINIVISNSTKVEDLLCKTIIDKNENKDIIIITSKTKLYEAIECKDIYPKTLVVLDGINNASPAILECISSIFGEKGTKILLPNGAILQKGNLNLIGIFNKGKDVNREKLPPSIIYNSLYLVVDDSTKENIKKIIEVLFIQNKLENEISQFQEDFIKTKMISQEVSGELPLTLNEIKKYLHFRIKFPELNKSIFLLFIFAYHFSEKSNREKIINELKLDKLAFNPEIKYDGSNKFFYFKTSKEGNYEQIKVNVYHHNQIKKFGAKNLELYFESLTLSEKYCILLLICSLKAKKSVILQGSTAAGKSFVILTFSLIMGQKLNIYQMNSNSGMSILTGQSIIKHSFDQEEKDTLKKAYKTVKSLFQNDYNPTKDYKTILKSIKYKLKQKYKEKEIEKLKKVKEIFLKITSPPSRFAHQESVFTKSIESGKWVLLDGIEMAPCIISEKISSLCDDNPELNVFESGKGIYFSKNPKNENVKKIHENFHLFITYNPNTKGVILLEQSLFNKCILFTLPAIDDTERDASTILYNSLEKKISPELCVEIAARLTNSHMKAVQISKLNTENFAGGIPFTSRNLLFISKEYNAKHMPPSNDNDVAEFINSCLELYYINSFISSGSKKEEFVNIIKKAIEEKPKFKPDIQRSNFDKYKEIVLILIKIQNATEGEEFPNFNFRDFVEKCMEVKIEEDALNFIIRNIQDTLNLLDYSKVINQNGFRHFKEQFYQIHIVRDLFIEIKKNLNDVSSTQKDHQLKDIELLNIQSIKPILLRLKLLIRLLETEMFATLFKPDLLNKKAEIIMDVIKNMKNYKDELENQTNNYFQQAKESFFNLISVLYNEPSLLKIIDLLFPYSQFKDKNSPLYLAGFYIKAWNTLSENKINFTIITPEYKYDFIYVKSQSDRIYPTFDFNDSHSLLLSINTSIVDNKNKGVLFKNFRNFTSNIQNTMSILSVIHKLSSERDLSYLIIQNHFKTEYEKFSKHEENLSKHSFLISQNFFISEDTNEMSRMWGLIYNLNSNKLMFEFLKDNFLEVERDTYLVVNQLYQKIDNEENIDNYCKLTKDLDFFLNKESRLWKHQIGETIKNNEKKEYYEYILNEINNEIHNYKKLHGYWPEENLNEYYEILDEIKEEVEMYLRRDEENELTNQLKEKFHELNRKIKKFLRDEVKEENIKKILIQLSEKILELSKKPTEYLYNKLDHQAKILISLNKTLNQDNIDDVQWPQNPLVDTIEFKNNKIKILQLMIWYSEIVQQLNIIFDPLSSEQKIMNILIQLNNNHEIASISKYINERIFGFQKEEGVRLSEKEKKTIFQMLRGHFIFKYISSNFEIEDLINFVPYLNNLQKRIKISKEEFFYGFEMIKFLNKNFKIYFPIFEPIDILYIFISYKSDNKYSSGIIFNTNNFNFRAQDIVDKIPELQNKEKMIDIWSSIIVDLYINITNDKGILKNNNNQKIKEYLNNEISKLQHRAQKPNEKNQNLTKITILFNCSKVCEKFDKVISEQKKRPEILKPVFDDYKVFIKENDKSIDVISFLFKKNLLKKIHPFLIYFLSKYRNCCQSLFNSLKKSDIDLLYDKNIDYIPAWVLILRFISSSFIILYDNNDNIIKNKIEDIVQEKIISFIKENKEINTDWINLMLEKIPLELLNNNIHIFYEYFNTLASKVKVKSNKIKDIITNVFQEFYSTLIHDVFDGNFDDYIKANFDYQYQEKDGLMINLFKNPNKFLYNRIQEICNKKKSNFAKSFETLYKNLKKMNSKFPKLQNKIRQLYDFINKKKFEDYKISQNNRKNEEIIEQINLVKKEIKMCNLKIENLRNNHIIFVDEKVINDISESLKRIKKKYESIIDDEIEYLEYLKIPVDKNNKEFVKKISFKEKELNLNSEYIYIKQSEIDETFISSFEIQLKEKKKHFWTGVENYIIKKFFGENTIKVENIILFKRKMKRKLSKIDYNEDEILKEIKKNLGPVTYDEPPKFYFNSSSINDFLEKINKLKTNLEYFIEFIDKCFEGKLITEDIIENKTIFSKNLKDLLKDFAIEDKDLSDDMINLLKSIENDLVPIENELEKFINDFNDKVLTIIKEFNEIKDENSIFSIDCSLPFKPILKDNYLPINFKNLDDSHNDFSLPIISENKNENKLQCSYDKLIQEIGPLCPSFYSNPILINILLFVDDDIIIKTKKNEENKNENEEEEQELEKEKYEIEKEECDIIEDFSELVSVTQKAKKEDKNIVIQIKVPKAREENKDEKHIISFILDFESTKGLKLSLDCKIIIKTIPIKSILSSNKYSFLYQNQKYILNTDTLFSGEQIIFTLKNYPNSSLHRYFGSRIVALENNSADQPRFSRENFDEVTLDIPKYIKTHESQIPRLNCLFELVLNDNYTIPIVIDALIIPNEFNFELYDYYDKDFKNGDSPINIYASEEILDIKTLKIELLFKVTFPVEYLNIKGELNIFNNYNDNSISLEPNCKEIKEITFKSEIYEFKYLLSINSNFTFPSKKIWNNNSNSRNENGYHSRYPHNSRYANISEYDYSKNVYENDNKYIEFILNINNNTQKIKIKILEAPKIDESPEKYLNQFGLFKIENNSLSKVNKFQKGQKYISPFFTNKSFLKIDYGNSMVRNKDPNEELKFIFINSKGEVYVKQNSNEFKNSSYFYEFYKDYIPIIGLYSNQWFPLLEKYECYNIIIEKKEYREDIYETSNKNIYESIKKNFEKMRNNKNNFLYFGYLLYKNDLKIIQIIEKYFPQEIRKDPNIERYFDKYKNVHDERSKTLVLHNLFIEIYNKFKEKFNIIKENKYSVVFDSIIEINKKYYTYKEPQKHNYKNKLYQLSNYIKQLIPQIQKSKKASTENREKKEEKVIISKKLLIIGDKAINLEEEYKERSLNDINEKKTNINTENITIILPDINFNENDICLQYLMQLYNRCTLGTKVFPAFIKNAVTFNKNEDIEKAQLYFTNLYYYFKTKPLKSEKDYSIISSKTNEFFDAFKIMIGKMKNANISLSSIDDLNSIEFDETGVNTFVSIEEDKIIGVRPDRWNQKKSKDKQIIQKFEEKLSRNVNYISGFATFDKTLNMVDNFSIKNDVFEKKELKRSDTLSSILDLGKDNREIEKTDKLITNVFIKKTKLKNKKPNPFSSSKKIMGFIEDDLGKKERKIFSREDFNKVKFKEEDDIADIIEEMENMNETSNFHFEKSKNPNEGFGFPNAALLKSLPLEKDQQYPVHQLLEDSSFLISKIISNVSSINLLNEIPFRDIEANILLDCTRTISDENKLFMILITCGLTSALNALEIPYCVGLIGDSNFKIIIKSFEEPHSEEALQRIMECIFISRYKTDLATCIKYAIDKFPHNCKNRVFYTLTNGMDPELKKINRWKEVIFNNKENSFSFIFIESRVLKPKQKQYLTEQVWEPFREKAKNNISLVTSTEISINNIGNNDEFNPIDSLVKCISDALVRSNIDEKEIFEATPPSFTTDQNSKLDENLLTNISLFLGEELKKFTNIYYSKKILPNLNEQPEKLSGEELKNLTKNIGGVIIYNDLSKEIKEEISNLQKIFKIKREKINLSIMEYIFKPNLPTQPVLTDDGTHIDVNELIKYFLNPTPNPKIYREIRDGLVKNYGVTIVIDVSVSCLCDISFMHTIQTIRTLISSIGAIDIPCFDLIIVGDPEPIILCSERSTNEILSDRSSIWGPLFSFFKPKRHGDLASAIKAAYDLNSARRTEHTNRIFVCTDGLYSKSERKSIIKYVNFCMAKGVSVYGIGTGICAYGIEEIFPQIIYSLNPANLIEAISKCFSDSSVNKNNKMPVLTFPQKFTNVIENIMYAQDNKYFKALKKELNNIMVSNDAFPFSNEAIEIDPSQGRINPSTGITEMYKKDLLKGQKILIVMCYTCELNEKENPRIKPYNIIHSEEGEECIKTAIEHYGIGIDIVTNYKEAIDKLTHQEQDGYCDYYATWVMSGRPYNEMPDGADPGLVTQFIKVLNIFWKNGGSIVFCSDNQPFTFQTNLFLEQMVLPNGDKVTFRIGGNHPGEQILEADDSGLLEKKKTFNTKVLPSSRYERKSFANNLYQIYEGKTISFIGTGDLWDEKNFVALDDTKLLLPFVPFSRDSDGGINSIFYAGEDGYGDLVFDNSYTKFFLEMKECGTFRYVQNVAAWTAAPERSNVIYGVKPRDYRPKAVIYEITSERFTNFREPPKSDFDLLFMIDATGSMGGSLNMATKYCIDIWNNLKVKMPGVTFKFGGIFYRDPIDSTGDRNDYINLTDNIESFKSFVSTMRPTGGGDTPEDWVGAYNIALNKISWRKGVKCIIHIADAGAHGTNYSPGDRHPNEGPKLDSLIPQCVNKDFQIIAFNIGSSAINSFNVFKRNYESYGGKKYVIQKFDQNNDVGGYFTNLVIASASSCA